MRVPYTRAVIAEDGRVYWPSTANLPCRQPEFDPLERELTANLPEMRRDA